MLTVLELMMHEAVHHVYVLGQRDEPVGVVSFVDLLRCMEPPPPADRPLE